ncbi:hypothetical protein JHK86_019279 [Glycine max]|nr:hypothetical protein JHK86_019279 [Glycine max]
MVAEASSVHHEYGFHGAAVVHDLIGDDNEMLLDSETNRRTLAGRQQYISYGALNANNVPCGNRGRSYYNCQQRGRANPYNRESAHAVFNILEIIRLDGYMISSGQPVKDH